MRLIPHLVLHDLRSQRLPLAAFAASLLVEAAVVLAGPLPDSRAMSGPWLPAGRALLTVALAALVVQQDSLVGTTAFWRTRPLSRLTLCAAKSTTLAGALLLLPACVSGLTWLLLGAQPGDALAAAAATAVEQATIVLFTVMAAVVTPTLTFLVVAGVAGITMVTLFNGVLLPALVTSWPFVGETLRGFQPTIYLATFFVLGVPVVVHQYLTLRDWRTAALIGVTLLLATTLARVWPNAPPRSQPVDPAVVNPARVEVSLPEDSLQRVEATDTVRGARVHVARYGGSLLADGQPDAVALWRDQVDARLLLRDRTLTFSTSVGGFAPSADPARAAGVLRPVLNAALAPARLPEAASQAAAQGGTFQAARQRVPLVALPLEIDRRYSGDRAVLTANVTLSAGRYRVVATTPARPGARFAAPGVAGEILALDAAGRAVTLRLALAEVFRPGRARRYPYEAGPDDVVYVLRHPERGEAVAATIARGITMRGTLGITGTATRRSIVTREFRPVGNEARPPALDAAWLGGAELVCLQLEYLGTFTRPAQVEFVLGNDPASNGGR